MRIISLWPPITEILFAIGAGEDIVLCTRGCDHPPGAKGIPKTALPPDIGRMKSMTPDLVLAGGARTLDTAGLEMHGFKVEKVEPRTLAQAVDSIERIGLSSGRQEPAKRLVSEMMLGFHDIRLEAEGLPCRPRTLVLNGLRPLRCAGLWVPDIIDLAGGRCICLGQGDEGRDISADELGRLDPDLLILCGCAEERIGLKALGGLRACREGAVHAMDGPLLARPGPRLLSACRSAQGLIRQRAHQMEG